MDKPTKPNACPSCTGTTHELIYTVILGWECRGCRQARLAGGRAAVESRRLANMPHPEGR